MSPSMSAFADEFCKIAEESKKQKSPYFETAKVLGAGALGMGTGIAVGLGGAHLADHLSQRGFGKPIPKGAILIGAPLLGTASGIAYSVYKAREQEAVQRALENSANNGERRVPGK